MVSGGETDERVPVVLEPRHAGDLFLFFLRLVTVGGLVGQRRRPLAAAAAGAAAATAAAALQDPGQGVPQLRQLQDLAVQQLQQRAQAAAEQLPLLQAALQALLQLPQPALQHPVPQLRFLETRRGRKEGGRRYKCSANT